MKRRGDVAQLTAAFRHNLRSARGAAGITQEQLAELCDLSTNYIARLEVGMSTPSFAVLARLARALGVSASRLLATESKEKATFDRSTAVAGLLDSLDERESEYVQAQLRNAVDFVLSLRKKE